jgi:hypothetical protein
LLKWFNFSNSSSVFADERGVMRWINEDIIKEESDTLVANNLEPKDVNKYVSTKVREMFFKLPV